VAHVRTLELQPAHTMRSFCKSVGMMIESWSRSDLVVTGRVGVHGYVMPQQPSLVGLTVNSSSTTGFLLSTVGKQHLL
jgi:hypothetical protein